MYPCELYCDCIDNLDFISSLFSYKDLLFISIFNLRNKIILKHNKLIEIVSCIRFAYQIPYITLK